MATKQSFKICFCFRRMFKLRAAAPTKEIRDLFEKYSENGTMSIDQLHKFLVEFQKEENASIYDAHTIFNSLKHLNIFQRKGLDLDSFFRYLFGDMNSPLPPPKVHHDMDSPLSHYFLYTGHNSYLTGNQLSSDSSVDPIIKALQAGVRVIELDLWPNNTKDGIHVCHGGTLTTPVELSKCLQAIKDNAFIASKYPVVITFEDHLNRDLQAKVAHMVTNIFGQTLFYPRADHLQEFPSPAMLKERIIISTKSPKEYLEGSNQSSKKEKENDLHTVKDSKKQDTHADEVGTDDKTEPDEEEEILDENIETPQYRRLICIHAGKLHGGLNDWLRIDPDRVRRLSLSEQELENAVRTHGAAIIRFTQRNLLRVFPMGIRLDSSNYNPFIGWTHGAQMVAFNMQGYGKFLWIMQGMFRANGGCGYVKKPDFLLNVNKYDEVFDPEKISLVKTILKVKIYMGDGWHLDFHRTDFDLCSPPDFYARIGIVGVEADKTDMKRTEAIEDQWVPVWNAKFEFSITTPELALLRIEVDEYDPSGRNDFAGQTCLPISELRSGIRAVPLHDRKGYQYRSVKLLMRFEFV